ncbi:MAG: hypothetical protein QOE93_399 [Actinomycetota bacterium]|jgi:hypothetical protein|nr:hypothetical protein [Actinomycetota bacterium]
MTAAEVAAFLGERLRLLRLATVDAGGGPRVVPVWYLPVDGSLLVTPRSRSAWLAHLQDDPRVGAVVDEEALPYRKVVISTSVDILHLPGDDDAWRSEYRALCLRYWENDAVDAYLAATPHIRRALVSIPLRTGTPEVVTWRLPVAGEDPRGIWASRYGPVLPA